MPSETRERLEIDRALTQAFIDHLTEFLADIPPAPAERATGPDVIVLSREMVSRGEALIERLSVYLSDLDGEIASLSANDEPLLTALAWVTKTPAGDWNLVGMFDPAHGEHIPMITIVPRLFKSIEGLEAMARHHGEALGQEVRKVMLREVRDE